MRSALAAAIGLALLLAAGSVLAAGDVKLGQRLTDEWCVSCHAPAGAARGSDSAPPLVTLMRGRKNDSARLRGWLAAPHPPMQGIDLSRQHIDDILAYLGSIATAP